ncbi:MAG: hypothetical protein ACHQ49_01750 [Elusimicrobiota bacterium]
MFTLSSRKDRLVFLTATAALMSFLAGCRQEEITVRRVPKEKPSSIAAGASGAEMSGAGTSSPEAAGAAGLRWTAPSGWKETPGDGMRLATFEPPQDAGKVEATVVALFGDAGGELANVNRWRGQLALSPVGDEDLAALRRSVVSRAGTVALYDFVAGDRVKTRMSAGMIKVGEKTWFFKLTGGEKAAEAARPAFIKLLEGLKTDEA